MEYNITDATFDEETKEGLVLIDFGQLGVVHVVCKRLFWNNFQKNLMNQNLRFAKWMLMKIQQQLKDLELCLFQH